MAETEWYLKAEGLPQIKWHRFHEPQGHWECGSKSIDALIVLGQHKVGCVMASLSTLSTR